MLVALSGTATMSSVLHCCESFTLAAAETVESSNDGKVVFGSRTPTSVAPIIATVHYVISDARNPQNMHLLYGTKCIILSSYKATQLYITSS